MGLALGGMRLGECDKVMCAEEVLDAGPFALLFMRRCVEEALGIPCGATYVAAIREGVGVVGRYRRYRAVEDGGVFGEVV